MVICFADYFLFKSILACCGPLSYDIIHVTIRLPLMSENHCVSCAKNCVKSIMLSIDIHNTVFFCGLAKNLENFSRFPTQDPVVI